MASLFGFEIRRKDDETEEKNLPTFAPEVQDDGAVVVAAGGSYGTYIDLMGAARTEAELVTKYREMSMHPEVERAVDDIVNEAIVFEDNKKPIEIDLDDVKLSPNIKKLITQEFDNVLKLMDFNRHGFDLFRRWYVDGRMYYHMIIDVTKPNEGIKELRYVDPRKLRKVREISRKREKNSQSAVTQIQTHQEYFVYNERGFANKAGDPTTSNAVQGVKIAPDSIIHATSGLLDAGSTLVLSHLHKAIKPLNQLRALEDATIVYRISRAPERRIFYIDVGNLPKMKAEQYLRDMMTRHKNKVVYDASTGEVRDDRKFMTMMEDYWFPRRDGSRGTEIQTLPGGQNLGQLEDVEYFQRVLYSSLSVPSTRLQSESTFNFGQDEAISRDEIKFSKFIDRLRLRFNHVFLSALEKHLILKNILTEEDWKSIADVIRFEYANDNYFEQQKASSLLRNRMATLQQMDQFVGRYYSNEWIRKNVLYQSDEDMEEMDEQMMAEQENPLYQPKTDEMGNPLPAGKAPSAGMTASGPGGGGFSSTGPTEQFN